MYTLADRVLAAVSKKGACTVRWAWTPRGTTLPKEIRISHPNRPRWTSWPAPVRVCLRGDGDIVRALVCGAGKNPQSGFFEACGRVACAHCSAPVISSAPAFRDLGAGSPFWTASANGHCRRTAEAYPSAGLGRSGLIEGRRFSSHGGPDTWTVFP